MRASIGAALVALLLSSGTLQAEPRTRIDEERRYKLALDESWQEHPPSDTTLVFRGRSGLAASVTSFDSANRAAFRPKERDAFANAIEQGLRESQPGFRSVKSELARVDRVPRLDLVFSRRGVAGRETVHMRFLFRYRFSVVATVIVPAGSGRKVTRQARRFVEALSPYSSSKP